MGSRVSGCPSCLHPSEVAVRGVGIAWTAPRPGCLAVLCVCIPAQWLVTVSSFLARAPLCQQCLLTLLAGLALYGILCISEQGAWLSYDCPHRLHKHCPAHLVGHLLDLDSSRAKREYFHYFYGRPALLVPDMAGIVGRPARDASARGEMSTPPALNLSVGG